MHPVIAQAIRMHQASGMPVAGRPQLNGRIATSSAGAAPSSTSSFSAPARVSLPPAPAPAPLPSPTAAAASSLSSSQPLALTLLPPLDHNERTPQPLPTPTLRPEIAYNAADLEALLTAVYDESPFMTSTKKLAIAWENVKKRVHRRGFCLKHDTGSLRNKMHELLKYRLVRGSESHFYTLLTILYRNIGPSLMLVLR
jgi:hypothetical protein